MRIHRNPAPCLRALGVLLAVLSLVLSRALGQSTTRVSVDSLGTEATGSSTFPSISPDGRFVAFTSRAPNLVPGDTAGMQDSFVRDRANGTTERVSVSSGGVQANGGCGTGGITPDGRFVSITSIASNLVAGDTNGYFDAFVRDRQTGTTERLSVDSAGSQANGDSSGGPPSADGRFVAFASYANNLVPGDTNGHWDVFVRDRLLGTTQRVSVSSSGVQGNFGSFGAALSADGRFVAFESDATNLVAGDTNAYRDIFVRDLQLGTTERVSLGAGGAEPDERSLTAVLSADGRFVAFVSIATNLVAGDTNGRVDVFVRDRQGATTERVSVSTGGAESDGHTYMPSISPDGRFVAFYSPATSLVPGDTNGTDDVFLRDRQSGTTERVSVDSSGVQSNGLSRECSVSADGRFVAFSSSSSDLVAGDGNNTRDIFVRDRTASPGADLCQAGAGGVSACPCANPAANAPRGCDNSSATGGAQLTSNGSASLGADSVVFVTNGERPSATSIVLQGDAQIPTGLSFGQGVRCLGGVLKRLFTKTAAGGSIIAPGPGDPSVSSRSAALGDSIAAGSNRWYAVYYRDPIVLGGCPAASTFNVTQTQLVLWNP